MPPPGGPERRAPPIILAFIPETNSVNVRVHEAVFQFDEVVSERPQGASDLSGLFLISPTETELPHVSWHRTHISIRPRRGFRPNTVYTITMLPGLADLRNNVRRNGAVLTFSTGPTIPSTIVRGRVFDWLAGTPAALAFVQAYKPSDTTIKYVTIADSSGAFTLPHLPPETYLVRGFVDANHNHVLDRLEIWDTTRIRLADTARVELLAFLHDTLGPRITEVLVRDSVTLGVTFDRGLDTALQLAPALFTLKARDSSLVPISAVRSAAAYDSAVDSAARAKSDSIFRVDSARRAAAGLRPADTALARRREERISARRDSIARARRARPSRPSPIHEVIVQLGAPLHPGTYYRLQAVNIRGLLGKAQTSDRVFSMPKPESDTTRAGRAARDTARLTPRRAIPGGAQPPPNPVPPANATPPPVPPPAGDTGRPR